MRLDNIFLNKSHKWYGVTINIKVSIMLILVLDNFVCGFNIELSRLYVLIRQIPIIHDKFKMIVEKYIHKMGLDSIELVSETAINVNLIFFLLI